MFIRIDLRELQIEYLEPNILPGVLLSRMLLIDAQTTLTEDILKEMFWDFEVPVQDFEAPVPDFEVLVQDFEAPADQIVSDSEVEQIALDLVRQFENSPSTDTFLMGEIKASEIFPSGKFPPLVYISDRILNIMQKYVCQEELVYWCFSTCTTRGSQDQHICMIRHNEPFEVLATATTRE